MHLEVTTVMKDGDEDGVNWKSFSGDGEHGHI